MVKNNPRFKLVKLCASFYAILFTILLMFGLVLLYTISAYASSSDSPECTIRYGSYVSAYGDNDDCDFKIDGGSHFSNCSYDTGRDAYGDSYYCLDFSYDFSTNCLLRFIEFDWDLLGLDQHDVYEGYLSNSQIVPRRRYESDPAVILDALHGRSHTGEEDEARCFANHVMHNGLVCLDGTIYSCDCPGQCVRSFISTFISRDNTVYVCGEDYNWRSEERSPPSLISLRPFNIIFLSTTDEPREDKINISYCYNCTTVYNDSTECSPGSFHYTTCQRCSYYGQFDLDLGWDTKDYDFDILPNTDGSFNILYMKVDPGPGRDEDSPDEYWFALLTNCRFDSDGKLVSCENKKRIKLNGNSAIRIGRELSDYKSSLAVYGYSNNFIFLFLSKKRDRNYYLLGVNCSLDINANIQCKYIHQGSFSSLFDILALKGSDIVPIRSNIFKNGFYLFSVGIPYALCNFTDDYDISCGYSSRDFDIANELDLYNFQAWSEWSSLLSDDDVFLTYTYPIINYALGMLPRSDRKFKVLFNPPSPALLMESGVPISYVPHPKFQVFPLSGNPNHYPFYYDERNCTNGIDDDVDGLVDCQDSDCNGRVGGRDCDGNDAYCEYGREITCNDCFDNDADGLIDCQDPDCNGHIGGRDCDGNNAYCEYPNELTCNDCFDNDADGLTDYDDEDCKGYYNKRMQGLVIVGNKFIGSSEPINITTDQDVWFYNNYVAEEWPIFNILGGWKLYLNTSLVSATLLGIDSNIIGGRWIGGNWWKGFSESCKDIMPPYGICDTNFTLS